jgi:hypothetical protein
MKNKNEKKKKTIFFFIYFLDCTFREEKNRNNKNECKSERYIEEKKVAHVFFRWFEWFLEEIRGLLWNGN